MPAIDYRLAPEYPYPFALQDVLSAYLFLIDPPPGMGFKKYRPNQVILMGDSAGKFILILFMEQYYICVGGGLAIAATAWLRDSCEDYPLPAALALLSPWVDSFIHFVILS